MDPLWILCSCHWLEHQVRFTDCGDVEYPRVCMEFHLAQHGRLRDRIVTAIRYVLGRRSRYGDFDEVVLDYDTTLRLCDWLDAWLSRNDHV